MSIDDFGEVIFIIGGLLTSLIAGIYLGRASTEPQTVANGVVAKIQLLTK